MGDQAPEYKEILRPKQGDHGEAPEKGDLHGGVDHPSGKADCARGQGSRQMEVSISMVMGLDAGVHCFLRLLFLADVTVEAAMVAGGPRSDRASRCRW